MLLTRHLAAWHVCFRLLATEKRSIYSRLSSKVMRASSSSTTRTRTLKMNDMKHQAKNSILIVGAKRHDIENLQKCLEPVGTINSKLGIPPTVTQLGTMTQPLVLLEFSNLDIEALQQINKYSNLLSIRDTFPKTHTGPRVHRVFNYTKPLTGIEVNKNRENCNPDDIHLISRNSTTLTDDILELYHRYGLSMQAVHLRFFVLSLLNKYISYSGHLNLYGSSVTGLGVQGCDMDLSFSQCQKATNNRIISTNQPRASSIFDLAQTISAYPDFSVQLALPHARVPLVKMFYSVGDINFDITQENSIAVEMSQLLCNFSSVDKRFPQLVVAVKFWYRRLPIRELYPGSKPNNFILSLLVLFFLQTRHKPVLPSASALLNEQYKSDQQQETGEQDTDDLGELFLQFLSWFCTFPFAACKISLLSGQAIEDNRGYGLWIWNPFFEPDMEQIDQIDNFCRSVSDEQLTDLQALTRTWLGSSIQTVPAVIAQQSLDVFNKSRDMTVLKQPEAQQSLDVFIKFRDMTRRKQPEAQQSLNVSNKSRDKTRKKQPEAQQGLPVFNRSSDMTLRKQPEGENQFLVCIEGLPASINDMWLTNWLRLKLKKEFVLGVHKDINKDFGYARLGTQSNFDDAMSLSGYKIRGKTITVSKAKRKFEYLTVPTRVIQKQK